VKGSYHCDAIFVTFGDEIWQDALVRGPAGFESKVLLYSYFKDKFDGTSFERTVPAKIKYCASEEAWVFMHDNIRKSKDANEDCPWILQKFSNDYNILDVQGDEWTVWAGTFQR